MDLLTCRVLCTFMLTMYVHVTMEIEELRQLQDKLVTVLMYIL